jgi:2-oxoacid:acceptor oxidoreductase gamma subunit (pyruvate/2-ketoisovalerate family)
MIGIRLHGFGGQGAVIAADILAIAFVEEGKEVAAFPSFGAERRGSPVTAFVRFDGKPIREKCLIYNPDCLLVLDPRQLNAEATFAGIKPGCSLIVNASTPLSGFTHPNITLVGTVDATRIAQDELGRPITNTCMVGAFAGTTRWVTLESVVTGLREFFKGAVLEKNIKVAQRGFNEVAVSKVD